MWYKFRHGSNKTLVSVNVFDTPFPEADEQYDLVVCHYTGALIPRIEAIILGAVIPQTPISYLCHPLARDTRKQSVRCFQDYEQNCNTCKHLIRVPFKKDTSGLQPGQCFNEQRQPLYPREGNNILFAPDDCMLQPCYEGR